MLEVERCPFVAQVCVVRGQRDGAPVHGDGVLDMRRASGVAGERRPGPVQNGEVARMVGIQRHTRLCFPEHRFGAQQRLLAHRPVFTHGAAAQIGEDASEAHRIRGFIGRESARVLVQQTSRLQLLAALRDLSLLRDNVGAQRLEVGCDRRADCKYDQTHGRNCGPWTARPTSRQRALAQCLNHRLQQQQQQDEPVQQRQ
jgi:hypothetical protein